jgi:hypothetical protein
VNLGIHYRTTADLQFQYDQDLQEILTACGALNQNRQSSKSAAYCICQEAFPQHFQRLFTEMTFQTIGSLTLMTWIEKLFVDPFIQSQSILISECFLLLYHFADSFQVPVMQVLDALRNAWEWHPGRACSHYCPQDNMLWYVVHKRLLETAVEYGFY